MNFMMMVVLFVMGRVSGEAAAPKKKPAIKVSQSTIDSMKQMGMAKAISKANSGGASDEFVEGARRMYGNRVNVSSSPTVTKSASKQPSAQMQSSLSQTRVPSKSTASGTLTSAGVKAKKPTTPQKRSSLPGAK